MSRRKRPTPRRHDKWGPWFEDPRSPLPDGARLFGNGWWTVTVTEYDRDAGMAGALHLSIHDRHRSTRHDWRDFQRVKSELVGPEREAVELYPAESRLVDTANEYHLWVMPEGVRFPFGFAERLTDNELADVAPEDRAEAAAAVGLAPEDLGRARQRRRA